MHGGEALPCFPRPQSLLGLSRPSSIPEEKWNRLQAVARSALDGQLEIDLLRKLPWEQAHAALMQIHGVGPWTADGILLRGCGPTDELILSEPQLHHAVELAYGLPKVPGDEELEEIAQGWRPFRTWVTVLLTMQYYRETGGRAPTDKARGDGRKSGRARPRASP